ncbi:Tether containing UBX domain for GLUT4 [Cytospora mali]|uniref:Tether containing UBX domain for GLUT4 n=1 Tax=Cytospora mali TaxID=578113 RepID=A0A194VPT3_CYTMA|nr:Tether containing UBX domain for GLUT4 [Valsa mali]
MSSHVVVVAPDVKRVNVKVNPGTYMFDVLEEACKKLNLEVDKWTLKHQKNLVNLSDQFRITRLTAGAKLELVAKSKTTSVVNVALRLPEPEAKDIPNGRLTEKFRSDTTLWKMLRHFESKGAPSGRTLNFTDRGVPQTSNGTQAGSGQLYYEMPVLRIMSREISTLADYQKTLSHLGITSGSHMIQLSFTPTDKTLSDAMQETSQFFRDEEAAEAKEKEVEKAPIVDAPATKETSPASAVADQKVAPSEEAVSTGASNESPEAAAPAPDAMEIDTEVTQPEATKEVDASAAGASSLQPVGIFSAPTNSAPAAASIHVPDSVYTPTIAHAQAHQHNLQESAVNRRLKSDAELEAQARAEEAKVAAVKSVSIKVRFPDETSAQWNFGPEDTSATLYRAVQSVMAQESAPFKLVLSGLPSPANRLKDDEGVKHKLIRGYKLSGRVLVNLVWEDGVPQDVKKAPFMKGSFASQAKKFEVPDIPQGEEEGESSKPAPVAPSQPQSNDGGGGRTKVPKWLKLPGKK